MKFRFLGYKASKKDNLNLFFELDDRKYNYKGSYVLYDKIGNIICCTEDIFCKKNNELSKVIHRSRLSKLLKVISENHLTNCEIYFINEDDYLFDFEEYKLLLFSDRLNDHNRKIMAKEIVWECNESPFSKEIKLSNKKLCSIDYGFNLNHIIFYFNQFSLTINCFFKVIRKGNFIFSSYCMREKEFEGHFQFLERILFEKTLIQIMQYEKYIYRLLFTDDIEIFLYIDNRFKNNQQIILK